MDTFTKTQQNRLDFESYLGIQNTKVRKNTATVSATDLPFPFMLHIDKVAPKRFIPMMPRRADESEDNTVPRVTVSDTLLGAMIGYAAVDRDYFSNECEGYIISAIDFDFCLKPTAKLVYDADRSNEHWLIGYNRSTLNYPTRQIGKVFITEYAINKQVVKGKLTSFPAEIILYVEVDEPFLFGGKRTLEKGFYRIIAKNQSFTNNARFDDIKDYVIEKIDRRQYENKKKTVAATLSVEESSCRGSPLYAKW